MPTKRQAVVPREVLETLLAAAAMDLILVGGQALKVWMDFYGVTMPAEVAYVSRDVDFLTASAADVHVVRRLASVLGGRTEIPKRRAALTALVGQAILDVAKDEIFNVDVLHEVFGADEAIRLRAVELQQPGIAFRVLHPLDVLKSRVDNLYGLREKQNELGKAQLVAAISVARAFLRKSIKADKSRRPMALRYVGFIQALATNDAGLKIAKRYGIHVADAIEPRAILNRQFRDKQLPRIALLMSAERRKKLGL